MLLKQTDKEFGSTSKDQTMAFFQDPRLMTRGIFRDIQLCYAQQYCATVGERKRKGMKAGARENCYCPKPASTDVRVHNP